MKKGIKKPKTDPRHLRRRRAVKTLFAYSFDKLARRKATLPSCPLAKRVTAKTKKINKIIARAAPKWPLEKINKTDLAILRLAVWELLYRTKVPPKVVINEAIELAKEYGGENSPGFINGVLGTVYKGIYPEKEKNDKTTTRKSS